MISQLRIKCPSCGVILEVRNSRHEAVKRISCPHCKKQLAVDFQEEEKPVASPNPIRTLYYGEMPIVLQDGNNHIPLSAFDYVEIKVVSLNDGNSKCIVRKLDEQHTVMVNGSPLGNDDEIVLAIGDELQSGESILIFGKPGKLFNAGLQSRPSDEQIQPTTTTPLSQKPPHGEGKPSQKHRMPQWTFAIAAFAIALLAIWYFWPTSTKVERELQSPRVYESHKNVSDSQSHNKTKHAAPSNKPKKQDNPLPQEKNTSKDKMTNYDLEQLALQGDPEAQYELGNRLIHKSGSSNVIRGINYLQLASRQGSSKARVTLDKAIAALQQKAENGDSVASLILMSINN
ncbi:MAG: hypothetical protein J6V92_08525 [Bacteroidaceae bacterium]|nr:hypothetical protein [Bacteroidaceae bacterium]